MPVDAQPKSPIIARNHRGPFDRLRRRLRGIGEVLVARAGAAGAGSTLWGLHRRHRQLRQDHRHTLFVLGDMSDIRNDAGRSYASVTRQAAAAAKHALHLEQVVDLVEVGTPVVSGHHA